MSREYHACLDNVPLVLCLCLALFFWFCFLFHDTSELQTPKSLGLEPFKAVATLEVRSRLARAGWSFHAAPVEDLNSILTAYEGLISCCSVNVRRP